jgi:hypothetical protein
MIDGITDQAARCPDDQAFSAQYFDRRRGFYRDVVLERTYRGVADG